MMHLPHARLAARAWLRPRRRSARLRLAVLHGGLFLLSGVALLATTYVLFERATLYRTPALPKIPQAQVVQALLPLEQAQHQLAGAQHQLAQDLSPSGQALSPRGLALPSLEKAQLQLLQFQYQLKQAQPLRAPVPLPLAQAQHQVVQLEHQLGQVQHQLALAVLQLAPVQHQLAQVQGQLAQAVHKLAQAGPVQAAQRAADSHQLLVNSGIALAIVVVLALLVGWLVAGRILRPIRTITSTAQRISSTSLHERLALDGPEDELKQLGDTLDDLFARLEAAFEAQRHFVANASHELRTPLARERTLVQVALGDPSTPDVWRSTAQELLASNRGQESLIEALLTLASSESGLEHRETADLADICRTVLACPGPGADRLGLQVETEIASAPFEGDPRLVERLVANLVDNAIEHNFEGGRVQVSTRVREGKALLSVANSGPVVPPSEVDRLFRPFQRLDGRRTHHNGGHGLGLSIVRAIASAHGAAVAASALPGGGLSVVVSFPPPAHLQRDAYETAKAQGSSAELQIGAAP